MNEDRLHQLAQRLGRDAAEGLDVERTAAAVAERLRSEPTTRPGWTAPAWLRVAAAVVLLVGAAVALRVAFPGSSDVPHTAHLVVDDLQDLSAVELEAVLATLDETLDLTGETDPDATLDDLNMQQLDAMLRSLEG